MSLIQKDTTFTKIFVGGLPYHTTDQSLRQYFEQFGEIEEAVVITDRQTGKSRGYGFVTMSEATSADKACQEPNPIIDGRKANVNLAYLGAKPRVMPTGYISPEAVKPEMLMGYGQVPMMQQYRYVYPAAAYMTSRGLVPMMQNTAATQQIQTTQPTVARSHIIMDSTNAATAGLTAGQQLPTGLEAAYYSAAAGHMTPMTYSPYVTGAAIPRTASQLSVLQHQAAHEKM